MTSLRFLLIKYFLIRKYQKYMIFYKWDSTVHTKLNTRTAYIIRYVQGLHKIFVTGPQYNIDTAGTPYNIWYRHSLYYLIQGLHTILDTRTPYNITIRHRDYKCRIIQSKNQTFFEAGLCLFRVSYIISLIYRIES